MGVLLFSPPLSFNVYKASLNIKSSFYVKINVLYQARTPERVQTGGIFWTNEFPSGNHPSPITTCRLGFRVHCSYILSPNISLVGLSLYINCSAHSTLKIYVFQLFIPSCNNYITYVARQSGDDKLYILYFLNHYWV